MLVRIINTQGVVSELKPLEKKKALRALETSGGILQKVMLSIVYIRQLQCILHAMPCSIEPSSLHSQMTDYEESYEQQLEGVGHPPTTVYRVSTHHAFQEHNGSSSSRSRSPSVGSHSVESSDSSIIQPATGDAACRESQQAVRHWTYEEQFRQVCAACGALASLACNTCITRIQ